MHPPKVTGVTQLFPEIAQKPLVNCGYPFPCVAGKFVRWGREVTQQQIKNHDVKRGVTLRHSRYEWLINVINRNEWVFHVFRAPPF